jgi:hypothetical protein
MAQAVQAEWKFNAEGRTLNLAATTRPGCKGAKRHAFDYAGFWRKTKVFLSFYTCADFI